MLGSGDSCLVDDLRTVLDESRRLQARVNKAAARTTTLNEQFLGRLSTDIHDGPAQDVALALMMSSDVTGVTSGDGGSLAAFIARTRGCLLKGASGPALLRALHSVTAGEVYVTPYLVP